ncbi:unnamed protein product [Didymodactylos carnosus]|uniref:Uncharacterized protein n=1 Tax=Didymodactylos carnosus TaxID=1234261 RepID=A0A814ZHV0_9BILA|nr:unnamed protein product [Didymodactylos carnosus]CAF1253545.1 unnamed protein product [Didymodactylos carnosus]CAF4005156.1 unnamed protein product [Didymodactylos carnosus]CAF4060753.1 unnamed protein product [Didymodactylos carnosus]
MLYTLSPSLNLPRQRREKLQLLIIQNLQIVLVMVMLHRHRLQFAKGVQNVTCETLNVTSLEASVRIVILIPKPSHRHVKSGAAAARVDVGKRRTVTTIRVLLQQQTVNGLKSGKYSGIIAAGSHSFNGKTMTIEYELNYGTSKGACATPNNERHAGGLKEVNGTGILTVE